jgi:hypothetical protein
MRSRSLLCTTLVALLAALSSTAHAAFNANNVETFDGTTLDTANWQVYSWQPVSPITQNSALTISCIDLVGTYINYADYTTLHQTVAVGQSVSVDVTVNQYRSTDTGNKGSVTLYLTTNSMGDTRTSNVDDYRFYIVNDAGYNSIKAGYGDATQYANMSWGQKAQPAGATYRYVINRTTDSSAILAVFDAANNSLGSKTLTLLGNPSHLVPAHPAPLYISLFVQGASATFDNVTVSTIPEPAALALLAPALLLLRRRR